MALLVLILFVVSALTWAAGHRDSGAPQTSTNMEVVHQEKKTALPRPSWRTEPAAPARHPDFLPVQSLSPSVLSRGAWCEAKKEPPPAVKPYSFVGAPVLVKVMTFNLFWWNLFEIRHGNGDSAEDLIASVAREEKYDVIGFQECENVRMVLDVAGLASRYATFQGPAALCMAFKLASWDMLAGGEAAVAEDQQAEYFGKRYAQWMRLVHKATGKTAFFVNHHGPLPLNTGGVCGGTATAHHLLRIVAEHALAWDAVFLVGDFNANAASPTVRALQEGGLLRTFSGTMCGGVDNIFSNVPGAGVVCTANLGTGGSDHDALDVVFKLGPDAPTEAPVCGSTRIKPINLDEESAGPGQAALAGSPTRTSDTSGACRCRCEWAKEPDACAAGGGGNCCWRACCRGMLRAYGGLD